MARLLSAVLEAGCDVVGPHDATPNAIAVAKSATGIFMLILLMIADPGIVTSTAI
jgi:hypothetical protein